MVHRSHILLFNLVDLTCLGKIAVRQRETSLAGVGVEVFVTPLYRHCIGAILFPVPILLVLSPVATRKSLPGQWHDTCISSKTPIPAMTPQGLGHVHRAVILPLLKGTCLCYQSSQLHQMTCLYYYPLEGTLFAWCTGFLEI